MGQARRLGSVLALAMIVLASASARAAPSQLERAKEVYAEGMKALEAKSYVTAAEKFEEAYRLAPDKHLFNYNIASAAELAGDCHKAKRHYQMFLDLVPKHPQRDEVQRNVAKLETSCVVDTSATETAESRSERDAERTKAVGERALAEAVRATQQSAARYQAIADKHGRAQPFVRMARAKKRDNKKIARLLDKQGIEQPTVESGDVTAPATLEQGCRQGEAQERRNAEAYAKAYEKVKDGDVAALMEKLLLRSEGAHMRAFAENCPR